ncbi:MAG: hypothetical protein IIB11_03515 [Chloroflexi bacterium]|nr:hypothetical protein [Chloroflexota bacterium]
MVIFTEPFLSRGRSEIGRMGGDGRVGRKFAELIKDVIMASEFLLVLVTFTGLMVALAVVFTALLWLLL